MLTYKETVNRFVVEYVDMHAPGSEHYKAKVEAGINPHEDWRLEWSFNHFDDAAHQADIESNRWGDLREYRVRDLGEPVEIERPVY